MKLDRNGLKQLEQEIAYVNAQIHDAEHKKGEIFNYNRPGNWREDPTYSQAHEKINNLKYTLINLRKELNSVSLIKAHGDESRVDIGDVVKLYDVNSGEIFKVLFTANYKIDIDENDDGVSEISINSPIGEAIFEKQTGEKVSYKVNDRTFEIEIINFEKQLDENNNE